MIEIRRWQWRQVAIGVGLLTVAVGAARAEDDGPVQLVERAALGQRTRVVARLEAEGRYLPGLGTDEQPVEPLELTVRTRLESIEQVLEVDAEGRPRRVLRRVETGEVTIGGEEPIRPGTIALRPEVETLVIDRVGDGKVLVASPSGPLTRPELDLLEMPADPIELPTLLPGDAVRVGDRWPVPDSASKSISGYDAIASQTIEATLSAIDDESAEIDLRGRIEGALLGGRGRIDIEGTLRFDRQAERIASVMIRRAERREPGLVEAGLEFRSTLRVERSDAPSDSAEVAAVRVPERVPADWLTLVHRAADGRYEFEHDRSWYVFSEDERQAVLRRLDAGTVDAQVNLVAGPTVEPGSHPKAERFRADVREALGDRYDRVIDAGQVAGPPGEYRYRLAIGGRQGDEPIVWYYYLVADASGRQLVAIFTMRESALERLGRRDQRIIGSLRWREAPGDASATADR